MSPDPVESPTRRLRALIAEQFKRRSEQRFAERVCAESLAALGAVRALRSPASLQGDALYEAVVAQRTGQDAAHCHAIVQRAHESLANWGSERAALFIDVVKVMIVGEYLAAHPAEEGMSINLDALLAARIDPAV